MAKFAKVIRYGSIAVWSAGYETHSRTMDACAIFAARKWRKQFQPGFPKLVATRAACFSLAIVLRTLTQAKDCRHRAALYLRKCL